MQSITTILNIYRRPQYLDMQIKSILDQSVKGNHIWAWRNNHEDSLQLDLEKVTGLDRWFNSNYNWKFYGRFAAALLADTEYVAIFDDDTIPGSDWFKNCLDTMSKQEGILGSAGVTLNSSLYSDHVRCGWPTNNENIERVDLVGHAWFFKREWLKYLWHEKPFTWNNGEDIQFSYLAQKYGGIQTYCPPHPKNNIKLHGSTLGVQLGTDSKASSTGVNISSNQFFYERDICVLNAIRNGWKTVKDIK